MLSQMKICTQESKQKEPPKESGVCGPTWGQLGYIAAQKSSAEIQESGGRGGLKYKYSAGEVT